MIISFSVGPIYWAFQAYRFRIGKTVYYSLPKLVFDWLDIKFSLATWLAYHFSFMGVIMATGLLYVVLSLTSGNWKNLFPTPKDFLGVFHIFTYALRIRKNPPVQAKYNPMHKLVYFKTVVAFILLVFSGVAIYKPARMA